MTPEQNTLVKTLTTAEEIFDYVEAHLRNQGQRSRAKTGIIRGLCRYRGPEGLMCAVGCLLADDEYDSGMEYNNIYTLVSDGILPDIPCRLRPHIKMLAELQDLHDTQQFWRPFLQGGFSQAGEEKIRLLRSQYLTD